MAFWRMGTISNGATAWGADTAADLDTIDVTDGLRVNDRGSVSSSYVGFVEQYTCTGTTPTVWTGDDLSLPAGLTINGDMAVTGDLDVTGLATVEDLNVNDFASVGGDFQIGENLILRTSTTPPAGAPVSGLYFDTDIDELMYYDPTRAKWLSVAVVTFGFGSNSAVGAGDNYKASGNAVFVEAAAAYKMPHNGTVIGIGMTGNGTTSTVKIRQGTSDISSLAHSPDAVDYTLNDNFSSGQEIYARNASAGSTVTGGIGWFAVRWRG